MLEIRLLGKFEVRRDGEIIEVPSRSSQSLLAYLVLNTGSRQRREKLAGLLWPDTEETKARRHLRQALWRLRKQIGHEYFLADRITLGFNPDSEYSLDVDVLKDDAPWSCAQIDLVANITDYAGELLPGFYDGWAISERERLNVVFDLKMQLLLNRLMGDQRWEQALQCGECWISRGHIPEPAFRALMIAHHGLGDSSRVSEIFQRCTDALGIELGVEPSQETRTLYERLLREDKPLDVLPPTPRHNLHQPLTSFVGREEELIQIRERLADPACRLLTLIGPGGIGKTRLALQAAHEMLPEFSHGVFFVQLEHIDSSDLILPVMADALGFSFSEGEEPETQLMDYLREKELLLIMDNLEHVLDGVGFLAQILKEASEVKCLATSRERLNLYGEWSLEIPGMDYPHPEVTTEIRGFSAVQLFGDRARQVSPNFTPSKTDYRAISRICRTVAGTPLAIELSAAWVPSLTCKEIADALEDNIGFLTTSTRDIPERHRSLRASFNHSWNLLSDEAGNVLRKLSVFRGGFQRQAAKDVAGASLATLSSLADKSLLERSDTGRYEIHPLLWRFIDEELTKSTDKQQEAQQLHSRYYIEFLNKRAGFLRRADQDEALREIGDEIDNIRVTLNRAIAQDDVRALKKVLDVLRVFFDVRGWYQEGEHIFDQIARRLELHLHHEDQADVERALVVSKAMAGQAWFCHRLAHRVKALKILRECLPLARRFGFADIEADVIDSLGVIAQRQGKYQEARSLFEESLAIWKELGSSWWQAAELACLAHVERSLGHIKEAKRHADEALSLSKESGNQWGISSALCARGAIAIELEDFQEGERYYKEGLAISREIGFEGGIARACLGLGRIAFRHHEFEQAATYCHRSLAIYVEQSKGIEIPSVLCLLGNIHAAQGNLEESRKSFEEALELALEIESQPEILRAMVGLASLLIKNGEKKIAAQLLRSALTHPALKAVDKGTAEELLAELKSDYSPNESITELEEMEDIEIGELVKIILGDRYRH
ncbi:MAG: tetratricopeptide repeat protein [Anaerolineales bacterium]|nr:tetratricopeptide repeat protein [Anaerolineales bacterium]